MDLLLYKIKKTDFKKVFKKMKYTYFSTGVFNVNIIGVRRDKVENKNTFDDYIVVEYYNDKRNLCRYFFPCTTTPGKVYLNKPQNKKGCSILVPGQYRSAFTIGKHKDKYEALIQKLPVKVYRDNNKDNVLNMDPETIESGMFGINIHKAGYSSSFVNNWSAGCQVFKREYDFDTFMGICHLQANNGLGTTFTYTLIDEKDLVTD